MKRRKIQCPLWQLPRLSPTLNILMMGGPVVPCCFSPVINPRSMLVCAGIGGDVGDGQGEFFGRRKRDERFFACSEAQHDLVGSGWLWPCFKLHIEPCQMQADGLDGAPVRSVAGMLHAVAINAKAVNIIRNQPGIFSA